MAAAGGGPGPPDLLLAPPLPPAAPRPGLGGLEGLGGEQTQSWAWLDLEGAHTTAWLDFTPQ